MADQHKKILDKATKVFKEVFDISAFEIKREMTAADIAGWDSLSHIRLISSLEDEFKIQFSVQDIMGMQCIGDILDIVVKKAA